VTKDGLHRLRETIQQEEPHAAHTKVVNVEGNQRNRDYEMGSMMGRRTKRGAAFENANAAFIYDDCMHASRGFSGVRSV
jgi:hypothetical protein